MAERADVLKFDRGRRAPVSPPSTESRRTALVATGVVLALLLLLTGVLWMADAWPFGSDAAAAGEGELNAARYVDVPPMVVTLRSADGRQHFLKLHFVIVAANSGQVARINASMPLILDTLQSFLRELRPEDLNGSAAVFRVKEEILVRLRDVLGHDRVNEVLVQDLIEQ